MTSHFRLKVRGSKRLWENNRKESFNGKLGDESLKEEIFHSLTRAEAMIENWGHGYSTARPHGSLNYRPPVPETIQSPLIAPIIS